MNTCIEILLIEDDQDDVQLLEESLILGGFSFNMAVIGDGADALDYFKKDNSIPHVIILDFNLPKVHGKEILKEYSKSKYADIPLIVLTTSSAKEDIDFAYKNGAVKYMIKPNTREGLTEVAQAVAQTATNSIKI
jgi:DNA-binding response OmpR family regulator